jgi:hypothetical protein
MHSYWLRKTFSSIKLCNLRGGGEISPSHRIFVKAYILYPGNRQKISLILTQIYVHPELIWIGEFTFWPSPLRIEGADSIALRGIFRDLSQCEGNLFWKGFRWCMKGSEGKSSNPDQFVWDSLSAISYHKSLELCIFLKQLKILIF